MNRRTTLKKVTLATGSMVILPAWAQGWTRQLLTTINSSFNQAEGQLLAEVADALIPPGQENVGALSVGVDKFLDRLFSDCYETEVQDKIKLLLAKISEKARNDYGSPFSKCTTPQKHSILEQCACADDEQTSETFELIKSETIRGFRTSKVVLTEYLDYQVIPGHFDGCAQVNS